jgi:mono/diheme cytochrome c family protein
MKTVLWTLGVAVAVVMVGGLATMYLGLFDVAAFGSRGGFLDWVMSTTMDNSVRVHASGLKVPQLEDSNMIDLGYAHYKEMCITCHGSPAGGQSEAAIGLNPPAPELSDAVKDWTPNQLYWIVKNGVRMTGMPAFAPTHSEKELWALVAFLERLRTMNPADYKKFVSSREGMHLDEHHGQREEPPRDNHPRQ